jgi:hypothetical protein
MSEEEIKKIENEYKAELAEKYTKEELIQKFLDMYESTQIVVSILKILTSDESSGADRALAREQGRKVVAVYNTL